MNENFKLRVIGLCDGNSPVTGEFPEQRASNAENVFIWWHHQFITYCLTFEKSTVTLPSFHDYISELPTCVLVLTDWDPFMMTPSNGNIFRVIGPLCGEFTGPGEFPAQRPVTRSFDVFFDLRLNKRLSKLPWGWWVETPSWSLWRQCNVIRIENVT